MRIWGVLTSTFYYFRQNFASIKHPYAGDDKSFASASIYTFILFVKVWEKHKPMKNVKNNACLSIAVRLNEESCADLKLLVHD